MHAILFVPLRIPPVMRAAVVHTNVCPAVVTAGKMRRCGKPEAWTIRQQAYEFCFVAAEALKVLF